MRRLLTRVVISSLIATGLILSAQIPATAGIRCQQRDPATGRCLIWIQVPGNHGHPGGPGGDGPRGGGSGSSCYWDPAKQGLSRPPAGRVPCTSEYGYWSNGYNCYIRALDPQPPADDPAWQGHLPGDGAVYECYQPQTDLDIMVWSQDPPPRSGAGPAPRDVAQIAIKAMRLRAINIGITPKPGLGSVGLVGMPVWMWVRNPDDHTYGPARATASAGGITVTATAEVQGITWDMGDGTKVVCHAAGTPYQSSFGKRQSPDCGHVYDQSSAHQPAGKYTVTATSDWVINWSGAGQTGTIRLNGLRRSVEVLVGEAQVLGE
jgi:hypothetical protein